MIKYIFTFLDATAISNVCILCRDVRALVIDMTPTVFPEIQFPSEVHPQAFLRGFIFKVSDIDPVNNKASVMEARAREYELTIQPAMDVKNLSFEHLIRMGVKSLIVSNRRARIMTIANPCLNALKVVPLETWHNLAGVSDSLMARQMNIDDGYSSDVENTLTPPAPNPRDVWQGEGYVNPHARYITTRGTTYGFQQHGSTRFDREGSLQDAVEGAWRRLIDTTHVTSGELFLNSLVSSALMVTGQPKVLIIRAVAPIWNILPRWLDEISRVARDLEEIYIDVRCLDVECVDLFIDKVTQLAARVLLLKHLRFGLSHNFLFQDDGRKLCTAATLKKKWSLPRQLELLSRCMGAILKRRELDSGESEPIALGALTIDLHLAPYAAGSWSNLEIDWSILPKLKVARLTIQHRFDDVKNANDTLIGLPHGLVERFMGCSVVIRNFSLDDKNLQELRCLSFLEFHLENIQFPRFTNTELPPKIPSVCVAGLELILTGRRSMTARIRDNVCRANHDWLAELMLPVRRFESLTLAHIRVPSTPNLIANLPFETLTDLQFRDIMCLTFDSKHFTDDDPRIFPNLRRLVYHVKAMSTDDYQPGLPYGINNWITRMPVLTELYLCCLDVQSTLSTSGPFQSAYSAHLIPTRADHLFCCADLIRCVSLEIKERDINVLKRVGIVISRDDVYRSYDTLVTYAPQWWTSLFAGRQAAIVSMSLIYAAMDAVASHRWNFKTRPQSPEHLTICVPEREDEMKDGASRSNFIAFLKMLKFGGLQSLDLAFQSAQSKQSWSTVISIARNLDFPHRQVAAFVSNDFDDPFKLVTRTFGK